MESLILTFVVACHMHTPEGHHFTQSLALDTADFEIAPGQMILFTGTNGSGKTTIVKILSGMLKPSKGVDDIPRSRYEAANLRKEIVFLGQSEVIYPVSIKENFATGLRFSKELLESVIILAKEAEDFSGAAEIIQRLGLNTFTTPCSINGYGIVNTPGLAAVAALRQHSPTKHIPLTDDERQSRNCYAISRHHKETWTDYDCRYISINC